MATHKILFKQLGENATTPRDPVAVFLAACDLDLTTMVVCCRGPDDNGLVRVPLYEVGDVTLPDFLPPEEWLRNVIAWKYAWGFGCDKSWSPGVQRALAYCTFSEVVRLAIVKLLKTKTFRSDRRKALRDMFVVWADGDTDTRGPYPYTRGMLELLANSVHLAREARRLGNSLYYSGRYQAKVSCEET